MEKYKAGYKKKYWFVDFRDGSVSVKEDINLFTLKHISRYTLGNMFPTMEAAVSFMKANYSV